MVFQKSEILKNAVSERWCADSNGSSKEVLEKCKYNAMKADKFREKSHPMCGDFLSTFLFI